MATPLCRKAITDAIVAGFPTLRVEDVSKYISMSDLPTNDTGVVLLLQFTGSTDDMVDIGGEGNHGFMERGSVVLHYMIPTGFDFTPHLTVMENIRLALRNKRFGPSAEVHLESVTPFSDQLSGAIRIDGGWHGWASYISFNRYECG